MKFSMGDKVYGTQGEVVGEVGGWYFKKKLGTGTYINAARLAPPTDWGAFVLVINPTIISNYVYTSDGIQVTNRASLNPNGKLEVNLRIKQHIQSIDGTYIDIIL